jgi:GT2 family glycosyltransferase
MPRASTSIVILCWNSLPWVHDAVASALALQPPADEVLVFDNASQDGTPFALTARWGSRIRLVVADRNHGYCGGYNRALRVARGEVLVLLNPDARLAPDFLSHALPPFADERVGIVAPLLLREDGATVDSSGQFLGRSRRTIDRGYGRPFDARRDRAGAVLAACGAAAVYRRAMVDDLSDDERLFDEQFFAYHEDLELGWRAWRAGWKGVHVPEARATHLRSSGQPAGWRGHTFSKPAWLVAHIVKNRSLTSLRHDSLASLLSDLPAILWRDLLLWGGTLLLRPGALWALWSHRESLITAWRQRRADRQRTGRFGRWRAGTPPRGLW